MFLSRRKLPELKVSKHPPHPAKLWPRYVCAMRLFPKFISMGKPPLPHPKVWHGGRQNVSKDSMPMFLITPGHPSAELP
jgi:hypothetical protein